MIGTSASSFRSTDFMVNLYERQYTHAGFIGTLITEGSSYSQKVSSFGGADQAEFSLVISEPEIEDWLANGLGRWIKVTDPELRVIWCGFINEISIQISGLEYKIGPVTEIANRVRATYTPQQVNVNPPITEEQQVTDWADDLDSQREFGIIEETISAYNMDSAGAEAVRDLWLTENAWPAREGNYRGDSDGYSMSVSCLGAQHSLNFFTFFETTITSISSPGGMIRRVLSANPNYNYLSTDTQFVGDVDNYLYVYQETGIKGLDAIRGYTSVGDDAGNKTLFWVDDERVCHFGYAPTEPEYFTTLKDASRRIFVADGTEVPPWNVQPGRWIQYMDLPILAIDGSLQSDPRNFFIESISYSMPYGLQINGSSVKTINQRLAQLSMMGNRQ